MRECRECGNFDEDWNCLASDGLKMKPNTNASKCRAFVYAIHEMEIMYRPGCIDIWCCPIGFPKTKRITARHLILTFYALKTVDLQKGMADVLIEKNVLPKSKYKQELLQSIANGEDVVWKCDETRKVSLHDYNHHSDLKFIKKLLNNGKKTRKMGGLYC